jgi:ankyrin repeat protein
MNAAHTGKVELVRLLIEAGAALDITAKYNLSALMLAIVARHLDVAHLLIDAGAALDIRSTGDFGARTALSLAEASGQDEIAMFLKKNGAAR